MKKWTLRRKVANQDGPIPGPWINYQVNVEGKRPGKWKIIQVAYNPVEDRFANGPAVQGLAQAMRQAIKADAT